MAKLTVNISDGSIEIEGDETFVLTAFADVRGALKELQSTVGAKPKAVPPAEDVPVGEAVSSEGQTPSKGKSPNVRASSTKKSQPSLNPNLDLSELADYVKKYKPTKNTERILVFAAFLRDQLHIVPCSEGDIYSCFHHMKSEMKIPEAFKKNMGDAKSEGYVDYTKLSEVSIPTMGENQLVVMSKKAVES